MAILQVEDIQKRFGRTRVLEDISFSLEQGQAMAIRLRQDHPPALPQLPGAARPGPYYSGGRGAL